MVNNINMVFGMDVMNKKNMSSNYSILKILI